MTNMSDSPLTAAEDQLRGSAWQDLSTLELTDRATLALAWALQNTGFPAPDIDPPAASYWRARALFYLGVIALRATRAGMVVTAAGYEPEALVFKRTLLDAHSRARRVIEDQSGQYARQWLQGQAGKPARAVSKWSPGGFWEMLSHSSHADYRFVENFLAVSEPDGTTHFVTAPERRPEVANPTLAVFAGETRDIANIIAIEHGIQIPGLSELDAAIDQQFPWAERGSGQGGAHAGASH
jgi:hypothetical protein